MAELTTQAEQSTPVEPESPPKAKASRASVGALWAIAGYGGTQVIRLVSNLILTRLLFEEAFGVMALVAVFMQGLQLFSDIGVGPNIVQNNRGDDPRFLNTAWTMQVLRGLTLWIIAWIGAAPFAEFYGEPLLARILPITGFTAFIAGLNSTRLYSQLRSLALKRFVSVDLISQAIGLITMVSWAWFDRSVWALVSGGITASVSKMVLTHTILPGHKNRIAWDSSSARAIFRFGGWIFFSTILTFLDRQAHSLVFAKMIPMSALGVYSIGVLIATMPTLALGHLTHNVLFPLYSRVLQRKEDVVPVFRRARTSVLLIAGWLLSGFIAGGQIGIDLLWDDRYAGAGWIVRLLSVGAWFSILEVTNGSAFLARGQANMLALANFGKLAGMLVLIPLGFELGGFKGAVTGYACTELCKYAISAGTISRIGLSNWRRDLLLTLLVATSAGCASISGELVRSASSNVLVGAVAVFLAATAIWAPVIWFWKRSLRQEGLSLFGD